MAQEVSASALRSPVLTRGAVGFRPAVFRVLSAPRVVWMNSCRQPGGFLMFGIEVMVRVRV